MLLPIPRKPATELTSDTLPSELQSAGAISGIRSTIVQA